MSQSCLPKKFCCCVRIKYGAIALCIYLVLVGFVQLVSLTGIFDLGDNAVLIVGDIACGVLALLSLFSIKKFKIGTPLKVLASVWLACIILNGVAWHEHVKREYELKQKLLDKAQTDSSTQATIHLPYSKTKYLDNELFFLQWQLSLSQQSQQNSPNQQSNKALETYNELAQQIKELDDDTISIMFILWTVFKLYSSLCILKLGIKMERKHGKSFYYQIV